MSQLIFRCLAHFGAIAALAIVQPVAAQGTLGGAYSIGTTTATIGFSPIPIGFPGCQLFPSVKLDLYALNKPWFPSFNSTGTIVATQNLGNKGCGWSIGNGGSWTVALNPPAPGTYAMMVALRMSPMSGCQAADGYCIYNYTDAGYHTFVAYVPPATANAIEYYHSEFNHYFVTANQDEITKLDSGYFSGWTRTGQAFKVFSDAAGHVAVCRFFSVTFAPKSSHFYTPDANECGIVKGNLNWQFEGVVFYGIPTDANGLCPAGTVQLFRLYNNGQGGAPNHRYTTSNTVRQQMGQQGWIGEGSTSLGIIMCVPT